MAYAAQPGDEGAVGVRPMVVSDPGIGDVTCYGDPAAGAAGYVRRQGCVIGCMEEIVAGWGQHPGFFQIFEGCRLWQLLNRTCRWDGPDPRRWTPSTRRPTSPKLVTYVQPFLGGERNADRTEVRGRACQGKASVPGRLRTAAGQAADLRGARLRRTPAADQPPARPARPWSCCGRSSPFLRDTGLSRSARARVDLRARLRLSSRRSGPEPDRRPVGAASAPVDRLSRAAERIYDLSTTCRERGEHRRSIYVYGSAGRLDATWRAGAALRHLYLFPSTAAALQAARYQGGAATRFVVGQGSACHQTTGGRSLGASLCHGTDAPAAPARVLVGRPLASPAKKKRAAAEGDLRRAVGGRDEAQHARDALTGCHAIARRHGDRRPGRQAVALADAHAGRRVSREVVGCQPVLAGQEGAQVGRHGAQREGCWVDGHRTRQRWPRTRRR